MHQVSPPWSGDIVVREKMMTQTRECVAWLDKFKDRTGVAPYTADKYFQQGDADELFHWSLQQTILTRDDILIPGVHVQRIAVAECFRRRGWCTHSIMWLVGMLGFDSSLNYVYVESVQSDAMRALMDKLCDAKVFEAYDENSYVCWTDRYRARLELLQEEYEEQLREKYGTK